MTIHNHFPGVSLLTLSLTRNCSTKTLKISKNSTLALPYTQTHITEVSKMLQYRKYKHRHARCGYILSLFLSYSVSTCYWLWATDYPLLPDQRKLIRWQRLSYRPNRNSYLAYWKAPMSVSWMTLKVIYQLQAFLDAIRQTFAQHFTQFQLIVCSRGPSTLPKLLAH